MVNCAIHSLELIQIQHDPKSLQRLITPEILQKMFLALGAYPAAVNLAQAVTPVSEDTEGKLLP